MLGILFPAIFCLREIKYLTLESTEGEGIILQTEKSVAIQVITKRH